MQVPDVLLSGNQSKITDWKKEQQIEITKSKRPDIWKKYLNNKSSKKMNKIKPIIENQLKKGLPEFSSGDTVAIDVRVVEGKERL